MHTARLLTELGAVLLGLGICARVANRLRVSPIPLYLLAGLALGKGGVYPLASSSDFIHTGSDIGVVLLLLALGLEYSAAELIGNLRRQAPAGLLDIAINALPGVLAGLILGWDATAILAMGGITAVSSSGIVAKVLTDLARLGNRETPAVLSVLVIEDLSMGVYLPLLTIVAAAGGVGTAIFSIGIAVAALLFVLFVALRFGPHISRALFTENNEALLLALLGLALLVAGIAQQLQVSDAVGAFLVGIALSGRVVQGAEAVISPLRDLFAAAFFLFFGFSTDPSTLGPALPAAISLAVVGMLTKLASGWYAARRAGVAIPGRIRAGAALIPRGEFSIVIASLVATTHASSSLAPTAAAYVLLMATLGPFMPRILDPLGRALAPAPRV